MSTGTSVESLRDLRIDRPKEPESRPNKDGDGKGGSGKKDATKAFDQSETKVGGMDRDRGPRYGDYNPSLRTANGNNAPGNSHPLFDPHGFYNLSVISGSFGALSVATGSWAVAGAIAGVASGLTIAGGIVGISVAIVSGTLWAVDRFKPISEQEVTGATRALQFARGSPVNSVLPISLPAAVSQIQSVKLLKPSDLGTDILRDESVGLVLEKLLVRPNEDLGSFIIDQSTSMFDIQEALAPPPEKR